MGGPFLQNNFVYTYMSIHPIQLDITTRHIIHFDKLIRTPTIKTLEGNNPSILRDFLDAILSRPRKVSAELGYYSDEFAMHDPLAGYYVIDKAMDRGNNSERWELRRRTFLMERMGEWAKGSCIVDRRWVLPSRQAL